MNVELAQSLLTRLQSDSEIQNYIAQADARYILFNVREPIENFPSFTSFLDNRLNQIAIKYLSIGCSFAENNQITSASFPLETAAKILEHSHRPLQNRQSLSTYYLLISSLAYYAANHYSKSFIIINEVEPNSKIASMIAEFLRKEYTKLMLIINSILLNEEYSDDSISDEKNIINKEKKILVVLYAKCFANLIEFIFSGNDRWLNASIGLINDVIKLSELDDDPASWWIARIFKIILDGMLQNSTWKNLWPVLSDSNEEIASQYILNLAFSKPHIVELFVSQRESLEKVLDPFSRGTVISLPTSSGKTRIAEIAIIDLLFKEPNSKVLYIAPFRSLAFEIEESFAKTFSKLGYISTHLYGGSQFSKLDEMLITESSIIIATPEKSKALIRANPELAQFFRLVIIDEGHLLGANERYILSELLIEELKIHLKKNDGKIFLLSAVLPNIEDISRWLTNEPDQTVISSWRPSNQRFGYLEWTGKAVNLRWKGQTESFNNNFVKQIEVQRKRSIRKIPNDKKEAVAATAIKLMDTGTVLIFVGQTRLVFSQARSVLEAMGETPIPIEWENLHDWEQFIMSCDEAYGPDSELLEYAKYGILCHSSKLAPEVRLFMERLIRFGKPKIIISTNTLGQGVNLGITTVIFANLYLNHNQPIGLRDFWNIAGRAGRAFIDTEGKILFVVDRTNEKIYRKEKNFVDTYLDKMELEKSESGLLILINTIKHIATKNNVDFEILLQLISENNWTQIENCILQDSENLKYLLDQIDDSLLAFSLEYEDDGNVSWVENHFKSSLAYIQAERTTQISQKEVIDFLSARNEGIYKLIGDNLDKRTFIKGGVPLRVSTKLYEYIDPVNNLINTYLLSSKTALDLSELLKEIESLILTMPGFSDINEEYETEILDHVRQKWLSCEPLHIILEEDKKHALDICTKYFGYKIPFILNALSNIMKDNGYEDESNFVSELAVLCELGLPDMLSAKIYLSGIRSRVAAFEIKQNINEAVISWTTKQIHDGLMGIKEKLKNTISETTYSWLNIMDDFASVESTNIERLPNLKLSNGNKYDLNIRSYKKKIFLCSPDYEFYINVTGNKINFSTDADLLDVIFRHDEENNDYRMILRNPKAQFSETSE